MEVEQRTYETVNDTLDGCLFPCILDEDPGWLSRPKEVLRVNNRVGAEV